MKTNLSRWSRLPVVLVAASFLADGLSAHAENAANYIPEGLPEHVRKELERIPKLDAERVTQIGDADVVKEAIAMLAETLRALKSIRFVAVEHPRAGKFRGILSGEKYRIEEWSGRADDARTIYAFDGERGWRLNVGSGQMIVQNREFQIARKLIGNLRYSPLCIFDFVCTKDGDAFLTKKDTPHFWKALALRSSYQGESQVLQANCVKLRIRGGYDPHLEQEVTYDVYLNKTRGMWPVSWEAFDEDGIRVHQLVVEKSVEPDASAFPLPAGFSLWRSLWKGQFTVNGVPVKYMPQTSTIEFSEVSANDVSVADLTIDPALAKSIHDLEADTWIQTPR